MFLSIYSNGTEPTGEAPKLTVHKKEDGYFVGGQTPHRQAYVRARKHQPSTYCHATPNGDIYMGYGPRHANETTEFLHVYMGRGGDMRIARDMYCTLPLFYGTSEGIVVVSNDFNYVCSALPRLTLNRAYVRQFLQGTEPSWQTMFHEVRVLGERQVLHVHNNTIRITQPPPRNWLYNEELPTTNPRDFLPLLNWQLETFLQTRLVSTHFAFELSGGLDSSLAPLYMRKHGYTGKLVTGSMLLHEPEMRECQLQKLNALITAAQLKPYYIDLHPGRDVPPAIHPAEQQGYMHTLHELYTAGVRHLADYFQAQGITMVVTGMGGDQLFANKPHPRIALPSPYTRPLPAFVHQELAYAPYAVEATPEQSLLAGSTMVESLSRANIYIERGIWPVSPFHSVILFNFCQALAIQYRTNRNILRGYYQACGYPELLCLGEEDFSSYFDVCLRSPIAASMVRHYGTRPLSQALRLIHPTILLDLYGTVCRTSTDPEEHLFAIYNWLAVERNLRVAHTQARLVP
ncbi:MAG TPA: asparagine synthase-related protein [Candidatus Saccharimonadales bacterium]|nr:asparagine synthase-related protein [Candidatus Saccharimonadales bacterium]